MFDSIALQLAKATDPIWQAIIIKDKPAVDELLIPVIFELKLDSLSQYLHYRVSIFVRELYITDDSSNSFPASIDAVDSNYILRKNGVWSYGKIPAFSKRMNKRLRSNSLNPEFGSIRLGFNLSKDGQVSNLLTIYSKSKELENEAIKDFKKIEKNFKPAHENGSLVDSYVEFDFRYDEFTNSSFFSRNSASYANKARIKGNEYLENKEYEKAIPYLLKASNCYLDDIELLFQIALVNFQINKLEEGCDYLTKLTGVVMETTYPSTVKEEVINSLLKTYCGISE
jgi:tetratricopeptide (TPR) repeat protein